MKIPGLGPDSPLGRSIHQLAGGKLSPRTVRVTTFAAGLVIAFGLVALLFAVQVSSTPQFCGSCHIMKPYYESWSRSGHSNVACVECHIPPGITAEFRKKYEALSMVVKYFTGTYSTNPWVEVDDAACLRCHERRLLEGKVVFHDVLFDHTPHLTESRRGLKLRCTSCHSQIVQGSHIAVTVSTCALCHFMGQGANQGIGRCLNCHQIPDRVTTLAGTSFDHSQVKRLAMDCASCHEGVVRGDGSVPKERCVTCHNQVDRLAQYGNKDLLHAMHVSKHKVNCMNCHLEIQHGLPPHKDAAATPADAGSCAPCHGSGHSPQRDLYAGVGGRGVPRMPGPMYVAGVTCEGCHNSAVAEVASVEPFAPQIQRASAVSCMSCHGPGYLKIFEAWKQGVDSRVQALAPEMRATAAAMVSDPPPAWQDALYNFNLVERGHGIHNVNFAYALLDKAHQQLNEARHARGLGSLPLPWTEIAGSSNCLTCHRGIENQTGAFGAHTYSHRPHLEVAKLDCSSCHRPHEQRAPGEIVKFGAEGCMPCHHTGTEVNAPRCMKCHGDVTQRTVPSFRGEFSHKAHLENGLECTQCHVIKAGDPRPEPSACKDCHDEK